MNEGYDVLGDSLLDDSGGGGSIARGGAASVSVAQYCVGLLAALSAGFCSALQFALVTLGKRDEEDRAGCREDSSRCPGDLNEAFNNFGRLGMV